MTMKLAIRAAQIASVLALTTSQAAFAQTQADAQAQTTEGEPTSSVGQDIVVTAQFRSSTVQETPLAVTALNAELLNQKGITDVIGAANLAPNVQLSSGSTGYGGTAAIYIRGVGQRDPNFALEPGVGMYIDDIYYGVLSGAVSELIDIDRIEVLRGPQGTLAGKNSIGGAIRLFSQRPDDSPNAYVEVGAGSRGTVTGRAATNVTLLDDKLYGRIAIGGRNSGGYLDRLDYACVTKTGGSQTRATDPDCKLGTQGGRNILFARGSLLFTPTDGIENLLVADVTRDRSENPAVKTVLQSPLWAGSANYITGPESYTNYETYLVRPVGGVASGTEYPLLDHTPVDAWGLSNKLTIELGGNLQLTSVTGYRQTEITISSDVDGTPASVQSQLWNMEHEQFSQEVRLNGSIGAIVDWTVGGFYYTASGVSSGRVTIPGGLALGGGGINLDALFRDPVETRSKSAFGHVELHPFEGLTLTGAVRYTDDKKSFTFNRYAADGTPHPTLGALTDLTVTYAGDNIDYRVAADYQIAPGILAYAQVSTGYKGGGINPRPFFVSQALPYDPEKLISYEGGLKTRFFDRRATLNLAAFINDYTDFQGTLIRCDSISPFVGAPCAQSTNIGDARIKGVEAELSLEPIDGLNIDGSVGYLDFQYKRIVPNTGVTLDMTNEYTPKWTGAAGVQYRIDAGAAGSLTPRLDLSYRSRVETRSVNHPDANAPARTLLNAKLTWRSSEEDWQADVSVSNLLDKFYYNAAYVAPGAPYFAGVGVVGEPRTVLFTVRRNFN